MFGAHTSFNRNIVECKVGGALFGGISNSIVLIETLWNVKINRNIYCRISVISFNRNIVECKVLNELKISTGSIGFNRNIVECKVSRTGRNFVSVS